MQLFVPEGENPDIRLRLRIRNVSDSSIPVNITAEHFFHHKQGFAFPVLANLGEHIEYYLSLDQPDHNIPENWTIEFSDLVFGNRWQRDEIRLIVQGRSCPVMALTMTEGLSVLLGSIGIARGGAAVRAPLIPTCLGLIVNTLREYQLHPIAPMF